MSLIVAKQLLRGAKLIFWDFDGVIKDSVEAKAEAFEVLFSKYGLDVAVQVREHHEENGGMSRFDKIPLYLSWADQTMSEDKVEEYCFRFSKLAREKVLAAPWVNGVKEYIMANYNKQPFILVTATPEDEIIELLDELGLFSRFREVHGAPKKKAEVVKNVLERWQLEPVDALFIGDSFSDWNASKENDVNFLLRKTKFNYSLQEQCSCPMFTDLRNE